MSYSYQKVCDTVPANSVQLVFEFFHRNITKVIPNYETFLCFFYMNFVVCHKNYWKMIQNIDFIIPVLKLVSVTELMQV